MGLLLSWDACEYRNPSALLQDEQGQAAVCCGAKGRCSLRVMGRCSLRVVGTVACVDLFAAALIDW